MEKENVSPSVLNKRDTNRADARNSLTAEREKTNQSIISTMTTLLNQERKIADTKLSAERSQMDLEVRNAEGLLSSEINEHLKTKTSLTTRDEFLAIVSHDLKNPIGAAYSCADILLTDSSYKDMDPGMRSWIEFIKRNIGTSLRLISDLLDMERIAEGKLQINTGKYEINQIIKESLESFIYIAAAKNILLHSVAPRISEAVSCDRDRIMQVLSNLIGNALKFTPSGGVISLNAKVTRDDIEISVHDTGTGISKDQQTHVFNRFVQLKSKDRSGLGLGLYISKMIIETHQGRLWLDSEIGKGSTFYFSLPRNK